METGKRGGRVNQKLKEKILESVSAVLPITGIVLLLSILLVPVDLGIMVMFLVGAILLVIGMGFFQLGAEMSMTPLGEGIGVQISKARRIPLIFLIGFSMGKPAVPAGKSGNPRLPPVFHRPPQQMQHPPDGLVRRAVPWHSRSQPPNRQIGRALCRERV